MKRLLVVVFIALAVPCRAFGQAQTAQPPKPGPEVQKLAYWVGTWKSEGEVKVGDPSHPTGKFSSTDTCEWFAGGFHVVCRGEGTGPRGKMTDLLIRAYDTEAQVYTEYFISSRGETESDKMTLTGDTWMSTWEGQEAGKPAKFRFTEVQESPTSYTFKVEESVAGGPWTVIEEGKATKVAGDTAYRAGGDVSAPVPVKEVKPTTEVSDISGTYTLVSINGNKLPFSFPAGAVIRSGVFTINNDGTCSSKVTFSTPSGADSSREVSASYTREGSRLTMKWTGAGTTIGTVEGTTFTMDNEGVIMAYRK